MRSSRFALSLGLGLSLAAAPLWLLGCKTDKEGPAASYPPDCDQPKMPPGVPAFRVVKDDILYQAYYDGGVRLVDVSGELMGNLADQNREIAVFKSYDPDGYTANAPFVMNAMPWKGKVLFTDFNSGLWAAKLEPKSPVP